MTAGQDIELVEPYEGFVGTALQIPEALPEAPEGSLGQAAAITEQPVAATRHKPSQAEPKNDLCISMKLVSPAGDSKSTVYVTYALMLGHNYGYGQLHRLWLRNQGFVPPAK